MKHAQHERRNPRCGLTLIELVASLAVLTIGLMGAVSMYFFGLDKLKAVDEAQAAVSAAQNEIEYLKALPFAEVADVAEAPFRSAASLKALMNVRTALTVQTQPELPNVKQVTASVTWTGEHGRRITKRLTTLIADKGGA